MGTNRQGRPTFTLADVAREAGVSEITVSRVIRAKGPIAEDTRDRVQAAIRKVGYVPNRVAGALASAGSDLVGVVIPSLGNIVFPDVLRGLNDAVAARGYRTVVSVTDYSRAAERHVVRALLSWRPVGLVVTGCDHDPETSAMLAGAGVTVVEVMDADSPAIDVAVGMSHAAAARATADHLLARGYRRFGYVGHDIGRDVRAHRRRASFVERIEATGGRLVAEEVVDAPSSVPAGRDGLARLLRRTGGIDAVYFSNDDMAIGGSFHCMAAGIAVPRDLAFAGFNGLDLGQALPQPLTTVLTRRYDIGFAAGLAIMRRLDGEEVPARTDVGFELLPGATA